MSATSSTIKTTAAACGLLLLSLLPGFLEAQDGYLFAEVQTGVRLGWWQFNGGDAGAASFSNGSLDYSHVIAFLPLGGKVGWQARKWSVALGSSYHLTDEEVLRKHQLARNVRDRYAISGSQFKLWQFYVQGALALVRKSRYRLSASAEAGTFQLLADHPEEADFKARFFWGIGLENILGKGRLVVVVRPAYQLHLITTRSDSKGHRIFNFGVEAGLRVRL